MALSDDDKEFLIRMAAAHAAITQGFAGLTVGDCERVIRRAVASAHGLPDHQAAPVADDEKNQPLRQST